MKIVCTGANGFVGSHLVQRLEADGHDVLPVVRRRTGRFRREFVVSDFLDESQWRSVMDGADAACHLAALAHSYEVTESDVRKINVDGTMMVARAAVKAGVDRFLFMSSVKALGEESRNGIAFTERDGRAPEDAYGRAKADAEIALESVADRMKVITIRPPLVYGPGVKGNFYKLVRGVDSGLPLPFGSISNRRSLIYVGNLVDVTISLLLTPGADGIYHVRDGDDLSTPQLLRQVAKQMNRKARLVRFPVRLLEIGASMIGRQEQARRLTRSLMLDDSRVREETGWRPPFDVHEGIRSTVHWYQQQGRSAESVGRPGPRPGSHSG